MVPYLVEVLMQVEEVETTNSVSLADIVLALVAAYVKSYWRPGLVSAVVQFPLIVACMVASCCCCDSKC